MKRQNIRAFGLHCVGSMIDQAVYQMANAARVHDEDAVHKLRVSIRRLQQALRLFRDFLDEQEARKVRRQLRAVIRAAAEVRNRDIASTLLEDMGASAALISHVKSQRRTHMAELRLLLRGRAKAKDRWRARLGL